MVSRETAEEIPLRKLNENGSDAIDAAKRNSDEECRGLNQQGSDEIDAFADAKRHIVEERRDLNHQNNIGNGQSQQQPIPEDFVSRAKAELNKNMFWRVKGWMIVVFLLVVFVVVIVISAVICAGPYFDRDEQFDRSTFKSQQHFNGSFQMAQTLSSNETVKLEELRNKLANIFEASPALGRYFSDAETFASRNDSAVVRFRLAFVLPEEEQEQLRNFTLSREMVFNVFRQFLYDQDPAQPGTGLFIDPLSLSVFPMTHNDGDIKPA